MPDITGPRTARTRAAAASYAPTLITMTVIAAAAGSVMLAGCGTRPLGVPVPGGDASVAAGSASAEPGRTVSVAPSAPERTRAQRIEAGRSGTLTLTVRDDGATVLLRVGQTVRVVLGSGAIGSWRQPTAAESRPGASVLRRVSAVGGYPGTEPAMATFEAVRVGRAAISSISDARCLHATPPCEIPQRLWRVTVFVTR